MKHKTFKKLILLLGLLLPAVWCGAKGIHDHGPSHINIKENAVQGVPKASSIQATIDGHVLVVVFLENLGQVSIKVVTATEDEVETSSIHTPNGVNIYITDTGSYMVIFTLENGDEYYGEFEVTD